MKQFMRCVPYALVLSVVMLLAACSKDGAQGPAGAPGPAGPAGPKGDSGVAGNANVIYSGWLDVKYGPAQTQTRPDGKIDTVLYGAVIPAVKLDSVLLGKADVHVYLNLGTLASQSIVPLPYVDGNGFLIRFVATPKTITLLANAPISTATTANGKRYQYRYVITPGSTAARGTVNWDDYNQVKALLHLQD